MKIMGLDYGDARTGVAISDLLCTLVGSTTVLPSRNEEKLLLDIVRLTKENGVGTIVVACPGIWMARRDPERKSAGPSRKK